MCRKAQWTCAALAAGLLFSSAQAAAATITSTGYPDWELGRTGWTKLDLSPIWFTPMTTSGSEIRMDDFLQRARELPQDAPASEGATLAMCGGGLLILFGSVRRKKSRQ